MIVFRPFVCASRTLFFFFHFTGEIIVKRSQASTYIVHESEPVTAEATLDIKEQ